MPRFFQLLLLGLILSLVWGWSCTNPETGGAFRTGPASENPPALTGTISDTAVAGWYLEQSPRMIDAGKFERALEMAREAAGIYSKHGTPVRALDAQLQAGTCLLLLSNCNAALRDSAYFLFQNAMAEGINLLGETHSKVADAMEGIGIVLSARGQLLEGIEFYNKALKIRHASATPNQGRLIRTFSNIGKNHYALGQLPEALVFYENALTIGRKHPDIDRSLLVPVLINLAAAQVKTGQLDSALIRLLEAEKVVLDTKGPEHFRMTEIYTNLGAIYYVQGKYERALGSLQKAVENDARIFGAVACPRIAASLMTMSSLHAQHGNFNQGLECILKALELRTRDLGKNALGLAEIHQNVANMYIRLGNNEKGTYHYYRAIQLYINNGKPEHADLATVYNALGSALETVGKTDSALLYFNKALDVLQKIPFRDVAKAAVVDLGIGRVYTRRRLFEPASRHYRNALGVFTKTYGPNHDLTMKALGHLATLEITRDNPRAASVYIDTALQYLNFNPAGNPGDVFSLKNLVEFLALKANVEYRLYQKTGLAPHLKQVERTTSAALQALDELNGSFMEPAAKQDLIAFGYSIFEKAIAANAALAAGSGSRVYQENILRYMEQSKAFLLRESMFKSRMFHSFHLPDSLFEQEQRLTFMIGKTEQERYQRQLDARDAGEKDSLFTHYTGRLYDLRQDRDSLRRQFATRFPEYHRLRYENTVIELGQLQQELTPRQALLEYFAGDSSIFLLALRPDSVLLHEVKKDFPLKKWVNDLREGLCLPYVQHSGMSKRAGAAQYARAAHDLYAKLFEPVCNFLTGYRELVVVPDGELGYLPFDVLLSETPPNPEIYRTHRYLMQDHQISMAYSATLLRDMQDKQHARPPAKSFLGVAPYFPGGLPDSALLASRGLPVRLYQNRPGRLFQNQAEVGAVRAELGGDILSGPGATEERFVQRAADYRILHLATHGEANDAAGDYSYLAFAEVDDSLENEFLFNRELYELRLNADLVVLSACKTGTGELKRGEGVISLTRGFAFAGAKSIVTTLWSVEETPTKMLMEHFYENLKTGMPKDAALAEAKRAMLQSNYPAPFYWAAFVPVGDMAAVDLAGKSGWWWWAVGLAVGLFLLWRWRRK